jgi:DNA repair photolyase
MLDKKRRLKGRGTPDNPVNRFESIFYSPDPEWQEQEDISHPATQLLRDPSRTILSYNESPDVGFTVSLNPYRGCEHGCIYCLSGDTLVLMADGTTRRLKDVRIGDAIYGTIRRGWYRRYVKTRVLAHWSMTKPAYRVTLEDGTYLITGEDHRFLTEQGWKFTTGAEQGDRRRPHLTTNNKLMGTGAFARKHDLEGQAVKSSANWRVASLESLGVCLPLFDITTGTGDFIANGIVSHNCYARPTHEWLGFSSGLNFETRILVKKDAPRLLDKALSSPNWQPQVIALSGVTDPYQPVERKLQLTRRCLEVLAAWRNPVAIVTKNALVSRDCDLLAELAQVNAAAVFISITTLDAQLARIMEPRAPVPIQRLAAISSLAQAEIPVGVMVAPIIPGLTDHEMPAIVNAAAQAGARFAGHTIVRLPYSVKDLFTQWLEIHYPERKNKVLSRIRTIRQGKLNDPRWHIRMRGQGVFAESIHALFVMACRKAGLSPTGPMLSTAAFGRPSADAQLSLFPA